MNTTELMPLILAGDGYQLTIADEAACSPSPRSACSPSFEIMNDTPETNEAQFGTGRVSVDFARRLEKERESSQCFERPFRHIKYQRYTVVLLLQRISQGFVNCDQVFVSCLRYLLVLFCQSVEQFGRFCELTQRKVASIQLIKYKPRNCRNKEKSNQGETSPSELSDQTLQKIENGLQHDVLIISPNSQDR
jgi:hypothetical protein